LRGGPEENADQPPGSPMQRICKPNVTVKSHEQVAKVKQMFYFRGFVLVPLGSYKDEEREENTVLQCSIHMYGSFDLNASE